MKRITVLQILRERRGISQEELANKVNAAFPDGPRLSQPAVSLIENGYIIEGSPFLEKIAAIVQIAIPNDLVRDYDEYVGVTTV